MSDVVYEPFRTIPLAELSDELRFEFPDLPTQLFDHYLLKCAIIMAKKGKLVRRRAIVNARHGVTRYALMSPDGMEICAILSIRNEPICGKYDYEVPRSFTPPVGVRDCAREIAWYDDLEKVLHIEPRYCHGRYHVEMAVTPTMNDCELPEVYKTEFLDTLTVGARAHIMLISGRPWTNLQLGQAYYRDFMERIGMDSTDAATHKMRGAIHMNFGRAL